MLKKGLFLKYLEIFIAFLYLESLLWFTLINFVVGIQERWLSTPHYKVARHATCFIGFEMPPTILLESLLFTTIAIFGYMFGSGSIFTANDKINCRAVVKYDKAKALACKQNFYWMCLVPWTVVFTMAWFENIGQLLALVTTTNASHADNIIPACIFLLCALMIQINLASDVMALAVNGYCVMINVYKQNFPRDEEEEEIELDDNALEDIFTPD